MYQNFFKFFNFTNYTKNTLHTNIQHINKCSKFYFLHLTTFTYTKKNKIGVESVAKKRKKIWHSLKQYYV